MYKTHFYTDLLKKFYHNLLYQQNNEQDLLSPTKSYLSLAQYFQTSNKNKRKNNHPNVCKIHQ